VEIEPPDEDWLRKIAKAHGFTMSSHTVEVFGLCAECQRKLGK
jgi:Fur family ferric uptake transcriptional regulator